MGDNNLIHEGQNGFQRSHIREKPTKSHDFDLSLMQLDNDFDKPDATLTKTNFS